MYSNMSVLLVSRFIEGAISKREQMCSEYFKQFEILFRILHLLFNQLYTFTLLIPAYAYRIFSVLRTFNKFLELWLPGLRDEWLLKKNLIY